MSVALRNGALVAALTAALLLRTDPATLAQLRMDLFNSPLGLFAVRMLGKRSAKAPTHPPLVAGPFEILVVPSLADNYAYVVADNELKTAVIVDASDAQAVVAVLAARSLTPSAVLTTHKHWDHCAGNAVLRNKYPHIAVYGSESDFPEPLSRYNLYASFTASLHAVSHRVRDGDILRLGGTTADNGRMVFKVMQTSGHTSGSVCFYFDVAQSIEIAMADGITDATMTNIPTFSITSDNVNSSKNQSENHNNPDPVVPTHVHSRSITPSRTDAVVSAELSPQVSPYGLSKHPNLVHQQPRRTPSFINSLLGIPQQDSNPNSNSLPTQTTESYIPHTYTWIPTAPCLFTGDTLFSCGIGRFNSPSPSYAFHQTVSRFLIDLPPNTHIFPGHNYDMVNTAFAKKLDPSNKHVIAKHNHIESSVRYTSVNRDDEMMLMVPTVWTQELLCNPFLRVDSRARRGELWKSVIKHASVLRVSNASLSWLIPTCVEHEPKVGVLDIVLIPWRVVCGVVASIGVMVLGGGPSSQASDPILDVVRRQVVSEFSAMGVTVPGSTMDEVVVIGCLRALKDRFKYTNGQGKF